MIQIKNAKELDGMRKANALSAAALKYGGEHIEAGMTTWELDKLIYDFIVKHGGTPNFKGLYGFPGTACISLNDTIIHGIPSHDIVIRPGDIVSIDTGAKIDGFNGDNACTYAVGKVDLEVVSDPSGTPLQNGQAYFVRYKDDQVGPFFAFADAAAMHEALRQGHPEAEVVLDDAGN